MALIRFTPVEMFELGLESIGFKGRQMCKNTATCRFRTSFGVDPKTCADIFKDLQVTDYTAARIKKPDPIYFLMALDWLKTYKEENEMAGLWKKDEQTVRKWV